MKDRCPRCDDIGTVCLACDLPIDECECLEHSEPTPCDKCSPLAMEDNHG